MAIHSMLNPSTIYYKQVATFYPERDACMHNCHYHKCHFLVLAPCLMIHHYWLLVDKQSQRYNS